MPPRVGLVELRGDAAADRAADLVGIDPLVLRRLEARAAAEHEPDPAERARAAAAAEEHEVQAERVREDGRVMYDSAERRDGTARELEAKGIDREVVATRMRADVSQATPATEAVKGAGKNKAPKADKTRGRAVQMQRGGFVSGNGGLTR